VRGAEVENVRWHWHIAGDRRNSAAMLSMMPLCKGDGRRCNGFINPSPRCLAPPAKPAAYLSSSVDFTLSSHCLRFHTFLQDGFNTEAHAQVADKTPGHPSGLWRYHIPQRRQTDTLELREGNEWAHGSKVGQSRPPIHTIGTDTFTQKILAARTCSHEIPQPFNTHDD
jgi:hypothetical protein